MDPPEGCQAPPPGAWIRLQVRLFAGLREAMGWGERVVSAPAGATPAAVWQQLGLAEAGQCADPTPPATIRVAINQRFATAETALADGDELAFLPPISGG